MELKLTATKKILVVFAMIFVRATLEMDLSTSANSIDLRLVESSLLKVLGMKTKPVVDRSKAFIPQAMINIYEQRLKDVYETTSLPLPGKFTRSANIVRSYTHQESSIDVKFPRKTKFRLSFDLNDFPVNEKATSAELKLTIVPKQNLNSNSSQHRISVKDIVRPGIKGQSKPILRLIETKLVNAGHDQTVSLDVLPVVERWLSEPDKNFGLLINVKSTSGAKVTSHVRLKRDVNHEKWRPIQPLLLIYSDDFVNRKPTNWTDVVRRKRSIPTKHRRRKNECRRHPLWVDFENVGWTDWIVAPSGYEAYYCAGECPSQFGDHMNTTNHAIVQTLVHSVHPSTIPKPCCVPTTLTPISMLYLDDNNRSVLKTYQDMVVEGCGCR